MKAEPLPDPAPCLHCRKPTRIRFSGGAICSVWCEMDYRKSNAAYVDPKYTGWNTTPRESIVKIEQFETLANGKKAS